MTTAPPTWDLSALYAGPDDSAIARDLAEADRLIAALDAAPDVAAPDLAAYERANTLLARVAAFAALHDGGALEPVLLPRVRALAARAPALEDMADGYAEPPAVEDRVIATLLSVVAGEGPRLWYKAELEPPSSLLPWTWEEAVEIALEAADSLSPAMGDAVRRVLSEGRVHAALPGGALSHPAGDRGPYVRLMFDGGLRSVLTLAHELGHAAQQALSRPLGVLRCDPPAALAETVATACEQAAWRILSARGGGGGDERRALQILHARDLYTVVVRHAALSRMERKDQMSDGGWKAAVEAMAGKPAVKDERPDGWRAFPILQRAPGTAWIYPFARLAAAAVLDRRDDRDFADAWTALLSAGGTLGAQPALAGVGVDVAEPGFWQRALTLSRA